MKKRLFWKIALSAGFIPFIAALVTGIYTIAAESGQWTFAEYMLLYSFVYWPSYVIGIIIIAFSLYKLIKK